MVQKSELSVAISSLNERSDLIRDQWVSFEKKTNPSFFQTWAWLGSWWKHSGKVFNPMFFTVTRNGTVVALAIFTPVLIRRHYLITSRQYHLNESCGGEYDFTIEHNGILTTEPDEKEIARAIIKELLLNKDIDEIVFSGLKRKSFDAYHMAGKELGLLPLVTQASKYLYVNLDKLRNENIDYISTLSRNTRSKIRRSINAYESSFGRLNIQEASNLEQALLFLRQLKMLHQKHWESKGKPGSFKNQHWEAFILDMIRSQFSKNNIQLLKVSAGNIDIGFMLNLVHKGYINMLQSGFKYHSDSKMKPGYVAHYLAIKYNIKKGNHIYDFLSGESQYKDSLSSDFGYLYWLTLQKRKPKFALENFAIQLVRTLRRLKQNNNSST
jgi:CelD/BcsL family acetyltransferase involved in cellulose biosynthesis